MKTVCLAILNYNGVSHLQHLLPTALAAADNFPGGCSVLVLDNRSTEPDLEWLRINHPSVEVLVAPKNDYLFSYNWLAQNRADDVLVILNNDLRLRSDFLWPLIRHFDHNDVFAVSATSRDWNDKEFTCGPARLKSHHGIYEWDYQRENQRLCHTLFTSGGFMAVDRKKFLELGGFSGLFWPAYGEDLDLGFRAWRKGWRCVFEPESLVWHRENGSLGSGGESGRVARLMLRAGLLFQWSSLPPAAPWVERTGFIGLTAIRRITKGQFWWLTIRLKTWLEWRRIQKNHASLMTSPEQLKEILDRLAEVPSKP